MTEQYRALLATENLELQFTQDGIRRIAEIAWEVNERTENIGARRLHTVMEKLLDHASCDAADLAADPATRSIEIDSPYVDSQLGELAANEDLSRFIL